MFYQKISNLLNPKSLIIAVAFSFFEFNSFKKCYSEFPDKNLNKKYIEIIEKHKNIKIEDKTRSIKNWHDPKNDLFIKDYNIIERNKPNVVVYNILDGGFILNIKYLSNYLSDYKHSITQEEYDQYKTYIKSRRYYAYPMDHYLLKYKMKKDLNIPMKYPYEYYLKVNKALNKVKDIPGNTYNLSREYYHSYRDHYYEYYLDPDENVILFNWENYVLEKKKIKDFYKK